MGSVAEQLEMLLKAFVRLNELHAQPGDKCHMLANSIEFLRREIRIILAKGSGNKTEGV